MSFLSLDLFRSSTSAGDLDNDAALESVTELEYAAARGEASPSNPSAQASFERGLFYSIFRFIPTYFDYPR
ncbi:MAG: hypothetical protein DMENIID0002_15050 [Rickettsia endosymbiont of Sergentomyia squamirostris]|uniref:Uncharacterized protein n=1 Tax=Candidatus Tisiphia endosymbiont of Sergentomyia squamirostris TaxID=3113639 RepID=A0AAT9GAR3_9RICK